MASSPRILTIDNYDSFTYNLVHLVQSLNHEVVVKRNDEILLEEVGLYSHILISPGPGLPQEAGIVPEVIREYGKTRSIFGVCLGFQCLLQLAGSELVNMPKVEHGAQEHITIETNARLFAGLPSSIQVGRYHSWAFRPQDMPRDYRVTSVSSDGYVMSVEHDRLPLYGVQFHPESIMTEYGKEMLENWVSEGGA